MKIRHDLAEKKLFPGGVGWGGWGGVFCKSDLAPIILDSLSDGHLRPHDHGTELSFQVIF